MEVARIAAGDAAGLESALELMRLIQPQLSRDVNLLEWQYFETPGGAGHLYALRIGGMLAAIYGVVRQQMRVGAAVHAGWMVQDVMTHPSHRGRGYLHHLAEICLNDLRQIGGIGYTFPNEQSQRSFRRTGWAELCAVPRRSKVVTQAAAALKEEISAEEVAVFGKAADRIWWASGLLAGVVRDSEFLNWRYRKPGQQYTRFMLRGDRGVLILKVFDSGMARTVHICDLFVDENCPELIGDAIRFAESFCVQQGAKEITAWVGRGHRYSTQFDQAGLFLDERPNRFVFISCSDAVADTCKDARNWHLSQGDSDVY